MGGISSIVSGFGANSAAKEQAKAANNAAALEAQAQQQARADLARGQTRALQVLNTGYDEGIRTLNPLVETGDVDYQAYRSELGLGERPEGYSGFQETPGYQFTRNEGLGSIDAAYAARGGLNSGALEKARMQYATGLADQQYDNHLTRLGGLAQTGVNARGALSELQVNFGQDRANVFTNNAINSAQTRAAEGNALAEGVTRAGNAQAQGTQALFNIPAQVEQDALRTAGTFFGLSSFG